MNFKKKYKYQKLEMSEKKNSSKPDPNLDGIAREPEAPDAKNNDD